MRSILIIPFMLILLACSSNKRDPDNIDYRLKSFSSNKGFVLKDQVNARIYHINYNSIRSEFPHTKKWSNEEIENWLIKEYLLKQKVYQVKEEEDLRSYFNISDSAGYRSIIVPFSEFAQDYLLEPIISYFLEIEVSHLINKKMNKHIKFKPGHEERVRAYFHDFRRRRPETARQIAPVINEYVNNSPCHELISSF